MKRLWQSPVGTAGELALCATIIYLPFLRAHAFMPAKLACIILGSAGLIAAGIRRTTDVR